MRIRHSLWAIMTTLTLSVPLAAQADTCNLDEHVLQATTNEVTCLTLDDLKQLGATELETSTIWTEGVHQFTGVLLSDLLGYLGAQGSQIEATAINDYSITIPVSDAVDGGPIVAYLMNGETMSRRDKGPLWIVYPFDSDAKYRTETIYSRSIWQLNKIAVME
jgi:hypothetical protein